MIVWSYCLLLLLDKLIIYNSELLKSYKRREANVQQRLSVTDVKETTTMSCRDVVTTNASLCSHNCRGKPQVQLGSYFRLQYNNINNNIHTSGLVETWAGSVSCVYLGGGVNFWLDSTNISHCYFLLMF